MKKFNKVKVAESFQKTRVKMHKSGKRWIRTIMSHVGLIHLFKGGRDESDIQSDNLERGGISSATVLKGVAALGTLAAGGSLGVDKISAEDSVLVSDASSSTFTGTDVVLMASGSYTNGRAATLNTSVPKSSTAASYVSKAGVQLESLLIVDSGFTPVLKGIQFISTTTNFVTVAEAVSYLQAHPNAIGTMKYYYEIIDNSTGTTHVLNDGQAEVGNLNYQITNIAPVVSKIDIYTWRGTQKYVEYPASDPDGTISNVIFKNANNTNTSNNIGNLAFSVQNGKVIYSGSTTSTTKLGRYPESIDVVDNAGAITNSGTIYIYVLDASGGSITKEWNQTVTEQEILDKATILAGDSTVPTTIQKKLISPIPTYNPQSKTTTVQVQLTTPDGEVKVVDVIVTYNDATSISASESLSISESFSIAESVSESTSESILESVSESTSESVIESVSESVSESHSESLSESISESTSDSLSESISESTSESLSESISESVSESLSESVSESTSESLSESISESTSESLSESISESTSESLSESISESTSESLSESISESTSESLSESISESTSESLSESISES
ncbi:accessory Sec-dependent serine-rich glycoprotein adhesin, partial [Streptococcus iniae]|uniref:accessory Sec-dependent serine-rich glycoprotein adhesin n=2 Tax=Streptococcus iniae TaxID=1346 RepID=UPI000EF7AFC6